LPEQFFLASARYIEKKNLFTLIEAYADYHARSKQAGDSEPWSLVILGDGVLKPALQGRIEQLHLSDRVLLQGFKQYPELPAYYGLAGGFIHASTTEQWGLVVNEAMAAGLPVLVSERCGCASELVRNGENGYLFNPSDQHTLSDLMTQMSGSECNRAAMGQISQDIVEGYGPDKFADGLLKAVRRAKEVGAARPGIVSSAILQALAHRQ
jgi:glycosyltransferase involved in cell wall biosynthesis